MQELLIISVIVQELLLCNTIMKVIAQEVLINEKGIIVQEEQLSLLFKG